MNKHTVFKGISEIEQIQCRLQEISAALAVLQEAMMNNAGCDSLYVKAVQNIETSVSREADSLDCIVNSFNDME